MTTKPAIIWNGFHFKWEKYPHRLSLLGSRFVPVFSEENQLDRFEHQLKVKIGNWPPERAHYKVPYYAIASPNLMIASGTTELAALCMIEEGTTVTQTVSVPLSELLHVNASTTDINTEQVAVLLNGFSIQSMNNHSGWHFGGLGIEILGPARIEDNVLHFEVSIYARPARSPELMHHGNKDWNYRTQCHYHFVIDYLCIAGSSDHMYNAEYHLEQQDSTPRTSFRQEMSASIQGASNKFEHALTAISGFRFKLDAHDRALFKKRTGRYVRELGFMNRGISYDAERGRGRVDVSLLFANEGNRVAYLANKLKLDTSIKLNMLQLGQVDNLLQGTINGTTQKRLLEERQAIKF